MAARFELYQDSGGNWRWRLFAANNEQIAASGESFSSKSAAKNGAEAVKRVAASAPIEEVVPT
jgi:uncharacterized protein YegP (UPF0339 family)